MLKRLHTLSITPEGTVEHSLVILDHMKHARVPMCNGGQQPWELVVCFFVTTIQHPNSICLCLPCLPILDFITKLFFHRPHEKPHFHSGIKAYVFHPFVSEILRCELTVCLSKSFRWRFASMSGNTTF